MNTQLNLRLPESILIKAKTYSESMGFSNVQEFIRETLREKLFEEPAITEQELNLITKLAKVSKEKNLYKSEKELFQKLRA